MKENEHGLSELIAAVIPHLEGKGYTESYVEDIHRVYKHLRKYCDQNGISCFTALVGQQFLRDRYGVAFGTKTNRSEVRRAINMLSDYQQFGTVLRRTAAKLAFPAQFDTYISAHLENLQRRGLCESTIRNTKVSLSRLAEYWNACGIVSPSDITLGHLNEYIKISLCDYCKQRVAHELRVMRRIMKFFYVSGQHTEDLSVRIIKIHNATQAAHLPSAFTKEEIGRMLKAVDRSSPAGKRDYALLLLVSRLGLRADDVRHLRFENIDWDRSVISIVQRKTKEPLILPLPSEVGWALIDYLQHGRPATDAKEIFVRQVAPHIMQKSFNSIMLKYLRQAGIEIPKGKHHGLHSLRHSFATSLLERKTPIHTIQEVMGHLDSNTTKLYLSVDIDQLRGCALEVPYEEN
jgi:site-specific recombinase XerD